MILNGRRTGKLFDGEKPNRKGKPRKRITRLSDRQKEELRLIVFGMSYAEIAHQLNISIPAIHQDVFKIRNFYGSRNITQAAALWVMEQGNPIPEIRLFAKLMVKEIQANNEAKGVNGWKSADPYVLFEDIPSHMAKLQAAMAAGDKEGIAEYSADIANLCMMICDVNKILVSQ